MLVNNLLKMNWVIPIWVICEQGAVLQSLVQVHICLWSWSYKLGGNLSQNEQMLGKW